MNLKKLKSVTFSERVQQSPECFALAQQGTASLDDLLQATAFRVPGPYSGPHVRAEWDRGTDERGRSILTLRIWDNNAEGRARLTVEEITTPSLRDYLVSRAWRDLLRESVEKRLQGLMEDGDDAGA